MGYCDHTPDIAALVHEATRQVPKGMVTTYGDIAKALGDPAAARAVGEILSHNPTPIVVPCHRVIYSDGRTGWYCGHGNGEERKAELLRAEGIEIVGGAVADLPKVRFTDFQIPPVLKELRKEQDAVAKEVVTVDRFGELRKVAGLDVSYAGERAFAALAVYDAMTGELVEERTVESMVRFPYIPTYLSYREIPALRPLIRKEEGMVYLIDGQGILHPRGAGIASHIGVCLDVATVGAAKSPLSGKAPAEGEGPVLMDDKVRGYRLVQGKRGCYISTGHRVSLDTSVEVCRRLLEKGVPAPLRRAHELANQARRAAQ